MADHSRVARIRAAAHAMWLSEGMPEGRALDHWLAAEASVIMSTDDEYTFRPIPHKFEVEPAPADEPREPWPGYIPMAGDVLACWGGPSVTARLISWFTEGPSHVAIVLPYDGQLAVYEATSLSGLECLHAGGITSGVQVHDLARWLNAVACPVDLWRPTPAPNAAQIEEMIATAAQSLGRPYDYRAAAMSWLRITKWVMRRLGLHSPTADELICTEFVATVLWGAYSVVPDIDPEVPPGRLLRILRQANVLTPCGSVRGVDEVSR